MLSLLPQPQLCRYHAPLVIDSHQHTEDGIEDDPADEPVPFQRSRAGQTDGRKDERDRGQEEARFLVGYQGQEDGS